MDVNQGHEAIEMAKQTEALTGPGAVYLPNPRREPECGRVEDR